MVPLAAMLSSALLALLEVPGTSLVYVLRLSDGLLGGRLAQTQQ